MNLTEITDSKEYVYNGKIINLRKDKVTLPNGNKADREVVEHPGGVCVVPLTEDGYVYMVRQFRYPYGEALLEIPAGKLDKGEYPLACGKRELSEETGAVAEEYTFLGKLYPSPGYVDEIIYMYLAGKLTVLSANPDDDEFLEVEKIPLKKVVDMIMNNEITDSKTQTAILKAYIKTLNI